MSVFAAGENGDLLDERVRGGRGLFTSAAEEKGDLLEDRVRGGTTFSIPISDLDGDGGGGRLFGDRGGASIANGGYDTFSASVTSQVVETVSASKSDWLAQFGLS